MHEFGVAGTARSLSLGRVAPQRLPHQAQSTELVALCLQTEPYNAGLQQLYESVGFVDDGRHHLAWLSGTVPIMA